MHASGVTSGSVARIKRALPPLPHYCGLMRQSETLRAPRISLGRTVFAGGRESDLPGVILRESFSTCLDPYPGGSSGALARFLPNDYGLPDVRTRLAPCDLHTATSAWGLPSGLQSFDPLQARGFACHPGCSYRAASTAAGSHGSYVRAYLGLLPPRAVDRLTVRFGQPTVRGLPPL